MDLDPSTSDFDGKDVESIKTHEGADDFFNERDQSRKRCLVSESSVNAENDSVKKLKCEEIENVDIQAIDDNFEITTKSSDNKNNDSLNTIETKPEENDTEIIKAWSAIDDYLLILSMAHISNFSYVYDCLQFSKEYDRDDVEERWTRILQDATFSKLVKKRIAELSHEQLLKTESRIPFSKNEQEVIFQSANNMLKNSNGVMPQYMLNIEHFTKILNDNKHLFHRARTPQILLDHYRRFYAIQFKCSQQLQLDWDRIELSGSLNTDLAFDYQRPLRSAQARQFSFRKIKALSARGCHGIDKLPNKAIGLLRGRVLRHVILSDTVFLGRSTVKEKVEVDLSIEGPAVKVSRRQAIIEHDRNTGTFKIRNIGHAMLFIDGKPLPQETSAALNDGSMIEVASLRIILHVPKKVQFDARVKAAIGQIRTEKALQSQQVTDKIDHRSDTQISMGQKSKTLINHGMMSQSDFERVNRGEQLQLTKFLMNDSKRMIIMKGPEDHQEVIPPFVAPPPYIAEEIWSTNMKKKTAISEDVVVSSNPSN